MKGSESSIEDKILSIKQTLQRMSPSSRGIRQPSTQADKPEERIHSRAYSHTNINFQEIKSSVSRFKETLKLSDQSYEKPLNEVTEILKNKDKMIRELLSDLEDARKASNKIKITKDFELKELNEQMRSLQLSHKNDIYECTKEIELKGAEIQQVRYEKNTLKVEIERLENDKIQLKGEISALENKVSNLENDKKLLMRETQEMLDLLEGMRQEKTNYMLQMEDLEMTVQDAKLKEQSLEKSLKIAKDSLYKQESVNSELMDELSNLILKHRDEVKNLMEKHRAEIESMGQNINDLKAEKNRLKNKIEQLKELIKNSSELKYGTEAKEVMYKQMEEYWEIRISELEQKNKNLKKQVKP